MRYKKINNSKNYEKTFKKISIHYDSLIKKHKYNVKGSQQRDNITRNKRLKILLSDTKFNQKSSILDFGCGTGYLLDFLIKKKFRGTYTGIDLSKTAVQFTKKKYKNYKRYKFYNINILKHNLLDKYDYVIINGTFNNNTGNNWYWMKEILINLFKHTKIKLSFNNLSKYVDYYDKNLFYIEPEKVLSFSKKYLGKFVNLNHSYQLKKNVIPYEFTTSIYKRNAKKN